uniref:Uncharacterized protein n=1 Tax=Anguilla anguilla TaxID=7936 RepID=A0A0E9R3E7_ANGAN
MQNLAILASFSVTYFKKCFDA